MYLPNMFRNLQIKIHLFNLESKFCMEIVCSEPQDKCLPSLIEA